MNRRSIAVLISDKTIESTTESFHLVFAIAPALAAILTYHYGTDLHLKVELGLVIAVLIVNFFILWLRSTTDSTRELTLLRTFITNKLPPNRSGEKQLYNTQVAVIEAKGQIYFRDIETTFQKAYDVTKVKQLLANQRMNRKLGKLSLDELYLELKDWNLYFKPVDIDASVPPKTQSPQQQAKREFDDHLKAATAVVLVQSDELTQKPWVYSALSSWGDEHSDVPILLARDDKALLPDQIAAAHRFPWIPTDPKALPWTLLHRGMSRAKAWRTQAKFNRLIVWNLFYVSLLLVYIGVIWIGVKSKETEDHSQANRIVFKGMDEAMSTERGFRALAKVKDDSSLGVSYWYRLAGRPTVFVTTEFPHEYTQFENSNETVIGCAFVTPNIVIEGNISVENSDRTIVTEYDNYDKPLPSSNCQMKRLQTSAIKSIICSSYDDGTRQNRAGTVGICVFTKEEGNFLVGEDNRKYLLKRTMEFHKDFVELIENNKDVSLLDRQEKAHEYVH